MVKFKRYKNREEMLEAIKKLPYRNKEKVNFVSNSKSTIKPKRDKSKGFNIYYLGDYKFYCQDLTTGKRYSSISRGYVELVKPRVSSELEGLAMTFDIIEESYGSPIILQYQPPPDTIFLSTHVAFCKYLDQDKLVNSLTYLFYDGKTFELAYKNIESLSKKTHFFDPSLKENPDFVKKIGDAKSYLDDSIMVEYKKLELYQEHQQNKKTD